MSKLISIWGKNGSGKSTVASNLACAFAKRGHKTALVGAKRFYSDIQYLFNMEIQAGQSLRTLLSGGDSLTLNEYFIQCPSEKNIYLASLADADDCAGYRKLRVDMAVRFLNLVKKQFSVVLMDCDESVEDPLSMYSLTFSDNIIYINRPSVQSVVFAKAYGSIVAGLQIMEQLMVVHIGGDAADAALYAPFGVKGRHCALPYCKEIVQPRGGALPIMLSRGESRAAARYRREICALADGLMADGDGANSGGAQVKTDGGGD
ncbi:MAG: ParA family protein [Oscillospiraceae bacterium]|nr:ParA family protein [Oscillospiraceae bacterium]